MEFSNKFKIRWWFCLLSILSVMGGFRLYVGVFNTFDLFLFVFWFILVMFPIISEISLLGVNVKKDLKAATDEIKTHIAEIKNQIHIQPVFHISHANPEDMAKKIKNEIAAEKKEDERSISTDNRAVSLTSNNRIVHKGNGEKTQDRINKILQIEKILNEVFIKKYSGNYKTEIKIEDRITGKNLIADGAIMKDGKIEQLVEFKFITAKSFGRLYYIFNAFVAKIFRLGVPNTDVRFVVVSEEMNDDAVILIQEQVNRLNFNRKLANNLPRVSVDFYRFSNGELSEVPSEK